MNILKMVDFKNVAFDLCKMKNEHYSKMSLEELEGNITTCYEMSELVDMKNLFEQEREMLSKNFGDILKILGVGMFRNDFQIKGDKNVKYVVPEDEVQFLKDLIIRYRESKIWKKVLKQKNEKIPYDILGRYKNLNMVQKLELIEELKTSVLGLIRIYIKIQKYKVEQPEHGLSEFELTEKRKEFMTCIYRETSFPALVVMEPTFRRYEELLFWGLVKKEGTELDYQIEADLSLIFVDLANEMTELLEKTLRRMKCVAAKRQLECLRAGIPMMVKSEEVKVQDESSSARKKYQNRAKQEKLKEEIVKKFEEELEKCNEEDKNELLTMLTCPMMTLEELEMWEPQMELVDNEFVQELLMVPTMDMLLEIIRKREEEQDK